MTMVHPGTLYQKTGLKLLFEITRNNAIMNENKNLQDRAEYIIC